MNKAKNGSEENNSNIIPQKEFIKKIITTESSTQTEEEDDNINKNYKKAFIIKKKPKFESIILSKYVPIIYLMIISFYLYKKSLKGCELEESACLEAANIKKFYKYGYKLLLCSSIVGFILLLIFYNLISICVQLPFFVTYAYYFYTFQGVDLRNHGIYNSILLTITFYFFCVIYIYLNFVNFYISIKSKILYFYFFLYYFLYFSYTIFISQWNAINSIED